MAKELPYFKFEPNQWENGNIQICSRNDKGLFIDICSVYWSRVGDLPLQLVINKLCGGIATALDSLISAEIIRVENSKVIIDFLDEQLQEFDNLSSMNRENAKKRWSKQQEIKDLIPPHSDRNATASDSQCENDAIRGEERRGEEIRGEKRRREEKRDITPVFTAPTIEEVCIYFEENGYLRSAGERAFNYYNVAGWKDSKGNKVKNWKQKMNAVWFKDENKAVQKTKRPMQF